MKITADSVKKVAKLANLPLSLEEEEKYADQLSKILDYIDQLNQVKADDVEPTYNITGLENVLSPDEVGESLAQEAVLQNAPKKSKGLFVTKGVFETE